MGADEERAEKLRRLRRLIAEQWPEGRGREMAMRVLDDMVWEAHSALADTE
jgi:hypothetical protein